jgi:hypothetical protein
MQKIKCDPWNDKQGCTTNRTNISSTKKGSELFFSGHNAIEATVNMSLFPLISTNGIRSVILSGGSAGGQVAYFHTNYLSDLFRALSPTTTVKSNPQYGCVWLVWQNGHLRRLEERRQNRSQYTVSLLGEPDWGASLARTRCYLHTKSLLRLTHAS